MKIPLISRSVYHNRFPVLTPSSRGNWVLPQSDSNMDMQDELFSGYLSGSILYIRV